MLLVAWEIKLSIYPNIKHTSGISKHFSPLCVVGTEGGGDVTSGNVTSPFYPEYRENADVTFDSDCFDQVYTFGSECKFYPRYYILYGPRQANLVLIAYASSEGSGEPAHPRSLARTFAARSYKR